MDKQIKIRKYKYLLASCIKFIDSDNSIVKDTVN